jgi:nucleotidyltransferase/DNA polymerase involved in DNA repair
MGSTPEQLGRRPLATLRQFVRKPRIEAEVCELCGAPVASMHDHLLEMEKRNVVCACNACAILFGGSARQRYQRIPRDVRRLHDFSMDDHEWESLLIPINLAFFTYSSPRGRVVANYPSPGGVMESSLDIEYWSVIVERNPVLKRFAPDVEALLVNRIGAPQYYRAPVDHCFRLVGTLRRHWRGLSGGSEVWKQIDAFFRDLNELSGGNRA